MLAAGASAVMGHLVQWTPSPVNARSAFTIRVICRVARIDRD
jgi:hypothetical protein